MGNHKNRVHANFKILPGSAGVISPIIIKTRQYKRVKCKLTKIPIIIEAQANVSLLAVGLTVADDGVGDRIGGLTIYSPLSVSFIHDEKRLDVNQRSYRDGYLGTYVGTTLTYPLNGIFNIPADQGHYEIGAVIDSIFAGSRYSQPAGTHSDATILGLFIRMSY